MKAYYFWQQIIFVFKEKFKILKYFSHFQCKKKIKILIDKNPTKLLHLDMKCQQLEDKQQQTMTAGNHNKPINKVNVDVMALCQRNTQLSAGKIDHITNR